MSLVRRLRGSLLRLVRRRGLSMLSGTLLVLPAAWVQFVMEAETWWLQGLSLVVGATGIALFWTGLTGASPDWIED